MTIEEKIVVVARIAYVDGQIKAIRDYATWKDGEQLVGALARPLKSVIEPLEREKQLLMEKITGMIDVIVHCPADESIT